MTSPIESLVTPKLAYDTYELATITLHLREDLNIYIREYGGRPTCIIEDQLSSRFYRVGLAEYTFLSLLDGHTTFAGALGKCAAILKADAISEERATSLCQWLVQAGLATTVHSRSADRSSEASRKARKARRSGLLSLISQRIPLFCPQSIVEAFNRELGWIFSGPMILLWMILIGTGASTVFVEWDRLCSATSGVVSRNNWLWLAGTWLILRVIHESGHALMCARFGGYVREAGINLMMLIPLPYIDVTSSWRFASKWQRILVSSAGMLAELVLASIAAIVWSKTQPGMLNQTALNVMLSAGFTTLVFNANPLMRFDGYYILSDILEQPNLAAHGQQELRHFGRYWGLGLNSVPPRYPEGHRWISICYGVAAFIWRIVLNIGIVVTAESMLFGAGAGLAVGMIFQMIVRPAFNLFRFVLFGSEREHPSRVRFASVFIGTSYMLWAAVTLLPWFSSEQVAGVVDYSPKTEVRTRVSGFVDHYEVRHGDHVHAGQVIARLVNKDLLLNVQDLRTAAALSEHRAATYLTQQRIAACQVEEENLTSLRTRLRELEEQVEGLTLTCEHDGIILMESKDHIRNDYLLMGQLVATIGQTENLEVVATVDQDTHRSLSPEEHPTVRMHIDGRGEEWIGTRMDRIDPQATREIPHPALGAHAGGDLDVRVKAATESHAQHSQPYEFVQPRFLVHVRLPKELQAQLLPGQPVVLALATREESLGGHIRRSLEKWWNNRSDQRYLDWYRDVASVNR